MDMWVIYDHPRDYPDNFVVRLWEIKPDGFSEMCVKPSLNNFHLVKTLDEARQLIPVGLHAIPRFANDDPVIVEVWV